VLNSGATHELEHLACILSAGSALLAPAVLR
jgi:hypothetical protein